MNHFWELKGKNKSTILSVAPKIPDKITKTDSVD